MRLKWFVFCGLVIVCTSVLGQQKKDRLLSVVGVVWDKDSLLPLRETICRCNHVLSGVDENGCFSLLVNIGDTIRFSHVGYRPAEVLITDSLVSDNYLLGVFLTRDTVMLAEVLILPRYIDRSIRLNPLLLNAHQNLNRALWEASQPVDKMDHEMNQRMMIENFARQLEMKGMVDVRLGVGLYSLQSLKMLKNASRQNEKRVSITPGELNLLRRVLDAEKKEKMHN